MPRIYIVIFDGAQYFAFPVFFKTLLGIPYLGCNPAIPPGFPHTNQGCILFVTCSVSSSANKHQPANALKPMRFGGMLAECCRVSQHQDEDCRFVVLINDVSGFSLPKKTGPLG